jgi:hypothetical protein
LNYVLVGDFDPLDQAVQRWVTVTFPPGCMAASICRCGQLPTGCFTIFGGYRDAWAEKVRPQGAAAKGEGEGGASEQGPDFYVFHQRAAVLSKSDSSAGAVPASRKFVGYDKTMKEKDFGE